MMTDAQAVAVIRAVQKVTMNIGAEGGAVSAEGIAAVKAAFGEAAEASITPAANVAAVTTPNATDLATVITLANQLQTTLNAEIAALKTAGLQASA